MRAIFVSVAAIAVLAAAMSIPRAEEPLDFAKCLPSNFKSDGTKADTIAKIFARRDCIREQQKSRVGKWFCYVTDMAGIQKNKDGTWFAGKIRPDVEKFVATIEEVFSDDVRMFTCQQEYGLTDGRYLDKNNACFANYKITFSPRVAILDWSEDTYHFDEHFSHFTLYGTNTFRLYRDEGENSYVYRGRCEKIN
jgi:hypothetical protein